MRPPPPSLDAIRRDTTALGFTMASEPLTGELLRVLAAAKPGGRLLELGTGTGVGTAWLLAGMDAAATLVTMDNDEQPVAIARRHLGTDPRVLFIVADGAEFLATQPAGAFDLIFADTWPGKFHHLDEVLALLSAGGLYVIDDLLPQPSWDEEHAAKVRTLLDQLQGRNDLLLCKLDWSSGIAVAVKRSGDERLASSAC